MPNPIPGTYSDLGKCVKFDCTQNPYVTKEHVHSKLKKMEYRFCSFLLVFPNIVCYMCACVCDVMNLKSTKRFVSKRNIITLYIERL